MKKERALKKKKRVVQQQKKSFCFTSNILNLDVISSSSLTSFEVLSFNLSQCPCTCLNSCVYTLVISEACFSKAFVSSESLSTLGFWASSVSQTVYKEGKKKRYVDKFACSIRHKTFTYMCRYIKGLIAQSIDTVKR